MFTEYENKSDEELLTLSIDKPVVFGILVDRYQGPFLRKGEQIFRNRESAEDVAQEAFVKIYAYASSFRKKEGASFKSWAWTIFLRQCFSIYKKNKREKEFIVRLGEEAAEFIPDKNAIFEHERKINSEYLLSVISKLPNILRGAIELHFIEDRPQKEVAVILGISENAVRARIHRAKKELRTINILNYE